MNRIKWNSPIGVAIIGGVFTILATLIGITGQIILTKESDTPDPDNPHSSEVKLQCLGSRSNSGSIFDPFNSPELFTSDTTKHDDLLWICERSDGIPSIAFVEIPLTDASLTSGRLSVVQALLTIKSFRISGNPFASSGPLLLFVDNYGDLDIGDVQDLQSRGSRIRTFTEQSQLNNSIDLTEEVRKLLMSRASALQLRFEHAGRPESNNEEDRLTIDPQNIQLTLQLQQLP